MSPHPRGDPGCPRGDCQRDRDRPEVLGLQGKLDRIVPEAWADLLVVDGNLLRNVSCLLGQGEHIPRVMKAGKIQFDRLNP
jgi:imidazolonepropionase-like amidohydrolase